MYITGPRTAFNESVLAVSDDVHLDLEFVPVYLLTRTWNVRMAVGSYFIAILGAYTATQLVCSVSATQRFWEKLGWLGLASFSLGGTAVWAMHWVKMLAMKIGLPVRFNTATALVAGACAVSATFLTLAYDILVEEYKRPSRAALRPFSLHRRTSQPLQHTNGSDDSLPLRKRSSSGGGQEIPAEEVKGSGTLRRRTSGTVKLTKQHVFTRRNQPLSLPKQSSSPTGAVHARSEGSVDDQDSSYPGSTPTSASTPSDGRFFNPLEFDYSPLLAPRQSQASPLEIEGRMTSPGEPPSFLAQLFERLWDGVRSLAFIKGMLLGTTVLLMHYSAMCTMTMDAYFKWNPYLVLCSALFAWSTSVFLVCYLPIEPNAFRQATVAVVGPTGISCMHFLGIASGAIYTTVPPPHDDNDVSSDLPLLILTMAILTYVLAYALLTHLLTQSRNRLVDTYATKRQLWRAIAENEAFARANKAQSEFISVASHEIRTPLHAISGYTDLLLQTKLTEDQATYLEAVRLGCRSMQLITNNVLDFSKLEQNSTESIAHPSEVTIRDLVRHVLQSCAIPHRMSERELRRLASYNDPGTDLTFATVRIPTEKHVELLLLVEETVPSVVFLDEVYLTRILMNLISNALKFTDEGYVMVSVSIQHRSPEGGPQLCMLVKDTGIGVPHDAQNAIFEPFRQAHTSSPRIHAGAGLGLAISKQLCERMGGSVSLWSEPDLGSEFVVEIPALLAGEWTYPAVTDSVLPPISLAMAVVSPKTFGALHDLLEKRGFAVTPVDLIHPLRAQQPALSTATRLWIDIECFAWAPWLLDYIIRAPTPGALRPSVFILYDDVGSDAGLEVLRILQDSGKLSLVRRPIVVHELVQSLRKGVENRPSVLRPPSLTTPVASPFTSPTTEVHSLEHGSNDSSIPIPIVNGQKERETVVEPRAMMNATPPKVHVDTTAGQVPLPTVSVSGVLEPENPTQPSCILLVEDNLVNQKLGIRMLQKLSYRSDVAENGQIALDLVIADPDKYVLVLMDCQMPVMNGFECTRRLRALEAEGKRTGRLPILALTANVSSESREECRTAGADLFLSKPLLLNDLAKAIEQCLAADSGSNAVG